MLLDVLQQPNPVLREKALTIERVTEDIIQLATSMLDTMYHYNGVGLAAPQVGKPVRMITFDPSPDRDSPGILINPEITSHSQSTIERVEGCLSCRGFEGKVCRYEKITVKGMNIQGKKITLKAEGLLSRILQHEIDHLNGVIIVDKAIPLTPEEQRQLEEEDTEELDPV